jgi:hypothetical protein
MLECTRLNHLQALKVLDIEMCKRDETFEHFAIAAQLARSVSRGLNKKEQDI